MSNQQPVFFQLGTIAAHACATDDGFRQREVRFFAELFSNWIEIGGLGSVYAMHNTQISRYLTNLVQDGFARSLGRGQQPHYKLTRGGLFELLQSFTQRSYLEARSECFLVWYFLKGYAPQIRALLTTSGSEFSRAHRLEMESLLDLEAFISRQIRFADMELQRLNERVASAKNMARELKQFAADDASFESCVQHISKHYPYELNSQMPLGELLSSLPVAIASWEIFEGTALKAATVFSPMREEIVRYQEHLLRLQSLSK